MYKDGDKCPICGMGTLSREVTTKRFVYKGEEIQIADYVTFKCSDCEEAIVSDKTLKEAEKPIRDFQRRVDGLLTSTQIRKIRKSLGLTQKDMGNLLGGGEKSFARYENSTLTQSKAMDSLLRVLDKYPYAINALKPIPATIYSIDRLKYITREKSSYQYTKDSELYNSTDGKDSLYKKAS